MIELIKFEIGKIFSKKSVWILIFAVIWSALSLVYHEQRMLKNNGINSIKEKQEMLAPYEGEVITKGGIEKVEKYKKEIRKKEDISPKESQKVELLYFDYAIDIDPKYDVNEQEYNKADMKKELDILKKDGKTDTFEYKNLDYVHGLIKEKESPKFYPKMPWVYSADFTSIAAFLSTLVALGVATIFSNDYQSNAASIVLSSRNGKNKLIIAKIISAIFFSTLVLIIANSSYLIYTAIDSFKGWNQPLNSLRYYEATPFNISVVDFYIRGLGISFIGIILFTFLAILISLAVKNNLIVMLITLGIYHVPIFISSFMPTKALTKIFRQLNIAEVMRIETMFKDVYTYNIFGNPVLYSNLLITLAIIAIPVVVYMIMYFGKRQTL